MPQTQRIFCLASGKGGIGKSTLSGFLLHAFHELGYNTLGVDADPPGSLVEWSSDGSFPMPVVGLAVRNLHTRLAGVADGRDVVVVDCPPLDSEPAVVRSALRAATDVVIPMPPSPIVLHRFDGVVDALEEVESLRDEQPQVSVLLNWVNVSANSGPGARTALENEGFHLLHEQVTFAQRYLTAWGQPVSLRSTPFLDIATELLKGPQS